ncbi:hypothetical protein ACOCEA_10050 [Maribacter sp. CXY002]|uniref:hypothetical protein n=1 Tax=Maribacter luteocoastalis TaxID=3407671 RepID=UPI003B684B05
MSKKNSKKLSAQDRYDLLRLKAIQDVDSGLIDKYSRKIKIYSIAASIIVVIFGYLGYNNIQDLVSSEVNKTVNKTVDEEVTKTITPILDRIQTRVDNSWESSILAKNAADRISETSRTVESQISKSQKSIEITSELNSVVKDSLKTLIDLLNEQNTELDRLKIQMSNLFNSMKNETFRSSNENKYRVVKIDEEFAIIVFKLDAIPIPESVKLQYHIYAQPYEAFEINKNIIILRWGDNLKNLDKHDFYISYIQDPTAEKPYDDLKQEEGWIKAGDSLIFKVWQDSPGF